MVTDDLPWSVKVEEWLVSLLEDDTPIFGICYGHQLLARAAGGRVGYCPSGKEIGTVSVELLVESANDPLLRSLPQSLLAHVTHAQTVLDLPPGATRLATNTHEPNHAFRLGQCAWGVQFHPEYSADIMRSYVEQQAEELESAGMDVPQILSTVRETPDAAQTLEIFADIVERRLENQAI
jgi:GMP synthase (glutamine-hydrolysing)